MKKTFIIILNFFVALALVILPSLTSAVYDGGDGAEVAVKLDVSKDNVNWYNFQLILILEAKLLWQALAIL